MFGLLLAIGFWVAFGYGFMLVAQKLGSQNGIWAFIPILNVLLFLELADFPMWYIVLFIVPLVNLAIGIMIFWRICENCQKPGWYSLLIFVPLGNVALPYVLVSD